MVSSTDFRANLVKFMLQAAQDWEPIAITSPKTSGVFLSWDYWTALQKDRIPSSKEIKRKILEEQIEKGMKERNNEYQSLANEYKDAQLQSLSL